MLYLRETIHNSDTQSLKVVFSKHNRYTRTNNHKSAYKHLLNNRHEYGTNHQTLSIQQHTATHTHTVSLNTPNQQDKTNGASTNTYINIYYIKNIRHNERILFTFTGQDPLPVRKKQMFVEQVQRRRLVMNIELYRHFKHCIF